MFNENQLKEIAKASGLELKLIQRLLGSLPICLDAPVRLESTPAGENQTLDLGLRLANSEALGSLVLNSTESERVVKIAQALREYVRICPQASAWIGRGDFNPQRVPSELGKAVLQHACRTAGRVRAKIMKS